MARTFAQRVGEVIFTGSVNVAVLLFLLSLSPVVSAQDCSTVEGCYELAKASMSAELKWVRGNVPSQQYWEYCQKQDCFRFHPPQIQILPGVDNFYAQAGGTSGMVLHPTRFPFQEPLVTPRGATIQITAWLVDGIHGRLLRLNDKNHEGLMDVIIGSQVEDKSARIRIHRESSARAPGYGDAPWDFSIDSILTGKIGFPSSGLVDIFLRFVPNGACKTTQASPVCPYSEKLRIDVFAFPTGTGRQGWTNPHTWIAHLQDEGVPADDYPKQDVTGAWVPLSLTDVVSFQVTGTTANNNTTNVEHLAVFDRELPDNEMIAYHALNPILYPPPENVKLNMHPCNTGLWVMGTVSTPCGTKGPIGPVSPVVKPQSLVIPDDDE